MGTGSENIKQAFREGRKVIPQDLDSEGRRKMYKLVKKPTTSIYLIKDMEGNIVKTCDSKEEVADTISYSVGGFKNMVGNGKRIGQGIYKGCTIERMVKKGGYVTDI